MKPSFDAEILQTDPAVIALGSDFEADEEAAEEAAAAPTPDSRACQTALSTHKTALIFSVLFGSLVFVVALAAAISLIVFIYRVTAEGFDPGSGLAALSLLVTGGATVFLGERWKAAKRDGEKTLENVGKYCGPQVKQEVSELR